MLEAFKAAGAFANLMRNRETVVQAVSRVKTTLDNKKITAEGGGGAVKVTMTGRMRILDLEVDAKMLAPSDEEGLKFTRQIITDAVNKAIAKAQEQAGKEIAQEMSTLGLPSIPGLENLKGI